MTLITFEDGKPLMKEDGTIGSEQECCCEECCLRDCTSETSMSFTMSGCGLSATITIADPSLIPEGDCFPNAGAVFAGDFGWYVVTGQPLDQTRDPVEAIVFQVTFGLYTTDLNGVPLPAPVCGWRILSTGSPGLKCPGFTDFEAFIATPDPCQNISFVGP